MAPHSNTFAWKIPWMEEPGRLQSMGLLRVGHDRATSLSLSCIGERNGYNKIQSLPSVRSLILTIVIFSLLIILLSI